MTFYTLTLLTVFIVLCVNVFTVMDGEYLFRASRCKRCQKLDARIITWYDRVSTWARDSSTIIGFGLFFVVTEAFSLFLYGYMLVIMAFGVMRALDSQAAADFSMSTIYKLVISPHACAWLLPLLYYTI